MKKKKDCSYNKNHTRSDQNFLGLNEAKTEEIVIDLRRNKKSIVPLVIKGEEV